MFTIFAMHSVTHRWTDLMRECLKFFNDGGGTNVIIHKPVSTIGTGKVRYVCVRISIKNVTISAKILASSL